MYVKIVKSYINVEDLLIKIYNKNTSQRVDLNTNASGLLPFEHAFVRVRTCFLEEIASATIIP